MTTNLFFSSNVKSEQDLYEDLTIESIKFYGKDVYYLPRELVSRDIILDQAIQSKFSSAYKVEMYIDSIDGFEGEGDMFAKFGIEVRDQIKFVVAKLRWNQLASNNRNIITNERPKEGDLIYLPMTKGLFEIKFVDHKTPFYQLSNVPVYKLSCELFEYSDEELNTGIEEIDEIEQFKAQRTIMRVTLINGITTFETGELISQTLYNSVIVSGKLLARYPINLATKTYELHIGNIKNDSDTHQLFVLSDSDESPITEPLVCATSGAEFSINEIDGIESNTEEESFFNDPQAQNQALEKKADTILDFSEINPFGDPTNSEEI